MTWAEVGTRTGMRRLKVGLPDSPTAAGTAITQAPAAAATAIRMRWERDTLMGSPPMRVGAPSVLPFGRSQPPSDDGTSTGYGRGPGSVQAPSRPGKAATTTAQSGEVGS